MSPQVLLLILRVLAALLLYAFLAGVGVVLWRDAGLQGGVRSHAPAAHLRGQQAGRPDLIFHLAEFNAVGRAADNTIHLNSELVSAHHGRLTFQGGQWWLEDLGSTNGTRVNDIPVEEPLVVTYGDRLRFGDVCLALEAGDPNASRTVARE
jgi:pSer/pThr/pTyr-binding forkhead associated (FHA) protein